MIIDTILDRKDGIPYTKDDFNYILREAKIFGFDDIVEAMNSNKNASIVPALENYIKNNNYNLELIKFIKSKNWERR
jgi:hypothetical protein